MAEVDDTVEAFMNLNLNIIPDGVQVSFYEQLFFYIQYTIAGYLPKNHRRGVARSARERSDEKPHRTPNPPRRPHWTPKN